MQEQEGKTKNKNQVHRRKFVEQTAAATSFMILNSSLVRGTAANSAPADGRYWLRWPGQKCRSRVSREYEHPGPRPGRCLPGPAGSVCRRAQQGLRREGNGCRRSIVGLQGPGCLQGTGQFQPGGCRSHHQPSLLPRGAPAGRGRPHESMPSCEKPVAVDVAGCKHVMKIARQAEGRLSLDVGFQIRSAPPFIELTRRIHNGALGRIGFGTGLLLCRGTEETGLSQRLASGETAAPTGSSIALSPATSSWNRMYTSSMSATGCCRAIPSRPPGRAVEKWFRTGGNCYDHFNVTYTYPTMSSSALPPLQYSAGLVRCLRALLRK